MKNKTQSHVVLIHGLAGHRTAMWPLAWHVSRAGFQTSMFGYRSFFATIEHHAQKLNEMFVNLEADPAIESFHVVAHSMGSIIARQALLNCSFGKLHRVVMLAPPNDGSPAATMLSYALPFSRTVRQVSRRKSSLVQEMAEPKNVEVGVLAGSYDLVIPESSSHLRDEVDHTVMFSGHNGLLVRPAAAKRVIEFLHHGRFNPPTRGAGKWLKPRD